MCVPNRCPVAPACRALCVLPMAACTRRGQAALRRCPARAAAPAKSNPRARRTACARSENRSCGPHRWTARPASCAAAARGPGQPGVEGEYAASMPTCAQAARHAQWRGIRMNLRANARVGCRECQKCVQPRWARAPDQCGPSAVRTTKEPMGWAKGGRDDARENPVREAGRTGVKTASRSHAFARSETA